VSLFETRTPPIDFCNYYDVRAMRPELSFPRRDEGRDLLPFLMHHAFSLAGAVTHGEPHIRPNFETSVPVPPTCVGLPDRDVSPLAPPSPGFPGEV